MGESEYTGLPLNDDIEALQAAIAALETNITDLQSDIADLQTNLNSVGNGNPATMYSYKELWSDLNSYHFDGGSSWITQSTSDPVDITNMRFIMIKFDAYGTEGAGSGGSQRAGAVLNADHPGTYYTQDLSFPIFDTVANDDLPASWGTYYGFIPVYDLSGSYTVKFQCWESGGSVDIKNMYVYEQILIE